MEDAVGDVIAKAQRGRGINDDILARVAGLQPEEIKALKNGEGSETALRSVARILQLRPDALVGLANGWRPQAHAPVKTLQRFTTAFDGSMMVNAYLVWDPDTNNGAVFDTGTDSREIVEFAAERRIRIQMVLLTHTHEDHIADLPRLIGSTDARAFVSKLEDFDEAETFHAGRNFRAGNLVISTRSTHGHSRGGVTYVIQGLSIPVAVVGDAMFAGSIGGGLVSYQDALRTCAEHILTLPDNTLVCPGHGPMTTVGEEKDHNPFFPQFDPGLPRAVEA